MTQRLLVVLIVVVLVVAVAAAATSIFGRDPVVGVGSGADHRETVCVYPQDSIAYLQALDATLGTTIDCVMVYDNANPDWQAWEDPWFVSTTYHDLQWARWLRAGEGRQMILTLSMVPSSAPTDWRALGAAGAYDGYAGALGRELVGDGLGRVIINLDPEANYQSGIASIGSDPAQVEAWTRYWARLTTVMKKVPGAHFQFVWTVNAGYLPVPFASYYPGNAAVDIIGVDGYDALVDGKKMSPSAARWDALSQQHDGIDAVAAFAREHHKPLAVPEWGDVGPPVTSGGGDDPVYVARMAALFRGQRVAFESYFDRSVDGTLQLDQAPKSLAAYRTLVLHG